MEDALFYRPGLKVRNFGPLLHSDGTILMLAQ